MQSTLAYTPFLFETYIPLVFSQEYAMSVWVLCRYFPSYARILCELSWVLCLFLYVVGIVTRAHHFHREVLYWSSSSLLLSENLWETPHPCLSIPYDREQERWGLSGILLKVHFFLCFYISEHTLWLQVFEVFNDFSGRTNNQHGALKFEFAPPFLNMKMYKILQQFRGSCLIDSLLHKLLCN